jgi:hypothetical protein
VHQAITNAIYPQRTLLDANGDGHRDFYDTLLVLGTGSGWQADTLALERTHHRRTVSDLDADGHDDLILHYFGDSVRVFWGDSAQPLRQSSLVLNPDRADAPIDHGLARNPRIVILDLLQGKPALMTKHDVGIVRENGDQPRWLDYVGWRVNEIDVLQHADTIGVDTSIWHFPFEVSEYVAPEPVINRAEGWVGFRYDNWVAYDTTGLVTLVKQAPDTLILGDTQIRSSLLLPLNHPPTLDSTMVLYVSAGNVLSVSEWLTPDQLIPSETRAYYLTPQTINTTKIEQLVMWPDMTGDSIPELGVRRVPASLPASLLDHCFEIYDIAGALVSSVVMPRDKAPHDDLTLEQGRIVWRKATGDRVSIRMYDATGRLLEATTADASQLTGPGFDPGARGRGLRLVELTDAAGNMRRMTVVVR